MNIDLKGLRLDTHEALRSSAHRSVSRPPAARTRTPSDCLTQSGSRYIIIFFPATSTSLTNAQGSIISTMANAAEVLDFANEWNIEVILHGHEHQPSVTVARRWPVDVGQVFRPVATIGAGSFGAKREHLGPLSRNHYYIIVRRPDGILIRSRHPGTAGVKFVAHSDRWLPRESSTEP